MSGSIAQEQSHRAARAQKQERTGIYYASKRDFNCICGRDKRDNAILCASCWFLLPLQLRARLPFKASDPDYESVKKACLEYAEITLRVQTKTSAFIDRGPQHRRRISQENNRDHDRQDQILKEICGEPATAGPART